MASNTRRGEVMATSPRPIPLPAPRSYHQRSAALSALKADTMARLNVASAIYDLANSYPDRASVRWLRDRCIRPRRS